MASSINSRSSPQSAPASAPVPASPSASESASESESQSVSQSASQYTSQAQNSVGGVEPVVDALVVSSHSLYSELSLNESDHDKENGAAGVFGLRKDDSLIWTRAINLFRRVLPSMFVSTAFWLSVHTLGLCDMVMLKVTATPKTVGEVEIFVKFGLWAYSDVKTETSSDGFVYNYVNEALTFTHMHKKCIYPLTGNYGSSPFFFIDAPFRIARASAGLAVACGFLCMVVLWVGVARESIYANIPTWKRWLAAALVLCCTLEGLSLLVLRAEVCWNPLELDYGNEGEQDLERSARQCEIYQGASVTILSCCFWFFALIAMGTWPKRENDEVTLMGIWSSLSAERSQASVVRSKETITSMSCSSGLSVRFSMRLDDDETELDDAFSDSDETTDQSSSEQTQSSSSTVPKANVQFV